MGQLLEGDGIKYYFIHGSLPLRERVRILNAFRSPVGHNVLLMTLGTGAVGCVLSFSHCHAVLGSTDIFLMLDLT